MKGSSISKLILLALLLSLTFLLTACEKNGTWTLTVYSTENPDIDSETYTLHAIKSKNECLERGNTKTPSGGTFHCSYGCELGSGGYWVCDKICDNFGCRD